MVATLIVHIKFVLSPKMFLMKACSFLIVFLFGSIHLVLAQLEGQPFPEMNTTTLESEPIQMPKDVNGKYTVLGLAYSKKSEKSLNTWFQPIFNKFIPKKGATKNVFSSFTYDVNVYFIPMFTGINTAAAGPARKKALKNIDPLLHPYILFYKGKLKPYKESLDFERKDTPYLFVLDQHGKIVYATSGAYTEDKMDAVEASIE